MSSIVYKKAEFETAVNYYKPDVIFVTETRLSQDIASTEFMPTGYHAQLRKDGNSHGGSILLVIRDCYPATEVDMPNSTAEIVWAQVSLRHQRKLYLGAYYHSPSGATAKQMEELETSLKNLRKITRNAPSKTSILGGDFNFKDIDWEDESVSDGASLKQASEKFISILHDNSLSQLQKQTTREGSILDLFIMNQPGLVKHITTVPGVPDHDAAIIANSDVIPAYTKKVPRKIHIFSQAHWHKMREVMHREDNLDQHTLEDVIKVPTPSMVNTRAKKEIQEETPYVQEG